MRLQRREAAHPEKKATIVVDGNYSPSESTVTVQDLAWDEISGRLCVLLSAFTWGEELIPTIVTSILLVDVLG